MSRLVEQSKPRRSPAMAEAAANMTAALERKRARQNNPCRSPPVVETADSLAEAIQNILTKHAERYTNARPEWMLDRDIRQRYFAGVSRTHYWAITKRPGFPKATVISPKIKMRNRAAIERWLAEQPEAP